MSWPTSNKKILNLLEELRIKARKKTQECYAPNCNEKAIKSHIQQKNGSIKAITNDGHVVHLITCTYNEKCRYKFEKVGVNNSDILTFLGFCPKGYKNKSTIFFNLIPFNYKTILIVGCHKDTNDKEVIKLFQQLSTANNEEIEKYISDVLIKFAETWFISVELYDEWKKK